MDNIEQHDEMGIVSGSVSLRFGLPADGGGVDLGSVMGELRDASLRCFGEVYGLQVHHDCQGTGPCVEVFEVTAKCGTVFVEAGATPDVVVVSAETAVLDQGEPTSRADARAVVRELLETTLRFLSSPERRRREQRDVLHVGERTATERADALFCQISRGADRARELRLIVRCTDLTTLEGDDTAGRVRVLCAEARRPDPFDATVGPTAAVCVYPAHVALAAELTKHSSVKVASVAGGFPAGLSDLEVRLADIRHAVAAGADEVDIVLNRSLFLDGRTDAVTAELVASREAAAGAHLKVILEVGELGSLQSVADASRLAIAAGADTIKTSTGKTKVNASPDTVFTMAEVIAEHYQLTGKRVGIKIAGGVRTADDALGYVAIVRSVLGPDWLSPALLRFGASSLVSNVVEDLATVDAAVQLPNNEGAPLGTPSLSSQNSIASSP